MVTLMFQTVTVLEHHSSSETEKYCLATHLTGVVFHVLIENMKSAVPLELELWKFWKKTATILKNFLLSVSHNLLIRQGFSINVLRTKYILVYADSSYQENRRTCWFRANMSQLTPQSFPQSRRCLYTNRNSVDSICVYDRIVIRVIMCLFPDQHLGRQVRRVVCGGSSQLTLQCFPLVWAPDASDRLIFTELMSWGKEGKGIRYSKHW